MNPDSILKNGSFESPETKEEQKHSFDISSVENSDFELPLKTRNTAEVKSDDFLQVDHENSKTESSSNVGLETPTPLAS